MAERSCSIARYEPVHFPIGRCASKIFGMQTDLGEIVKILCREPCHPCSELL